MARLSDETLNDLKALDIKDVADRLGIELGRGRGNARCFNTEAHAHGDRHGSLGFNVRTNTFKCFACGVSGDTIALVQAYNNADFREACDWLASQYGLTLEDAKPLTTQADKPNFGRKSIYRDETEPLRLSTSLLDYNQEYQEIYQALYDLSDDPTDNLKNWWQKRGLSPALLKSYGWRIVSPEKVKLLLNAYDYAQLAKAGLVSPDKAQLEQFLRRYVTHNVIVPYFDETLINNHRVLYVRFRTLDSNQRAKYLAPAGSSPVIYGFDRLAQWAMTYPTPKALYITESETESIAITELARRQGKAIQAIALVGGQKTEHSLVVRELVKAMSNTNINKEVTVNIVTDRDSTGEVFYNAIATALYKAGFNPNKLYKWQETPEVLKANGKYQDIGDYLASLTEQPNG